MSNLAANLHQAFPATRQRAAAQRLFSAAAFSGTQLLSSAGLRIDGGSGAAVVEAQSAVYAVVDGAIVTKAAGTNMPALVGTVTNATFNVFVFSVNAAGTLATRMGVAGATLAAVQFPEIPSTEAVIGFVIINPTGTGDFVGGTTNLDDVTVVPNAVFINTTYSF